MNAGQIDGEKSIWTCENKAPNSSLSILSNGKVIKSSGRSWLKIIVGWLAGFRLGLKVDPPLPLHYADAFEIVPNKEKRWSLAGSTSPPSASLFVFSIKGLTYINIVAQSVTKATKTNLGNRCSIQPNYGGFWPRGIKITRFGTSRNN